MKGKTVIRLLMALTILVSFLLRPPGTMLVFDGDTITFEICTGGETENVTIALGGDPEEMIDLGCDFFAAQIAALSADVPDPTPTDAGVTGIVGVVPAQVRVLEAGWPAFNPRAPPLVS